MLYIATLAEIKAQLGIDDPNDDAALSLWLEGLQGRLDSHLGRTLAYAASVTEYFDGGGLALYVARYPVVSVASVVVSDDQDWSGESPLTEAAGDMRINYDRGRISYGTRGTERWPEGKQNIRVVYAGGYQAAEIPQAIKGAYIMQATFEWRNRQNLGTSQISANGATVQYGANGMILLPDVMAVLAPYRRF